MGSYSFVKEVRMNKTTSVILFLIILAFGLYWFIPNNENKDTSSTDVDDNEQTATALKFFSKEEILPTDIVIRQTKNGYEPTEILVKVGTRVVWVNETDTFIWPASNIHPTHRIYSEFDPLEPYAPGEAWALTFLKVGEWEFHDHLKANKQGVVKVVE